MNILACSKPSWTESGPSICALDWYLGNIVPFTVAIASAATVLIHHVHDRRNARQNHDAGYSTVNSNDEPLSPRWNVQLPPRLASLERGLLHLDFVFGLWLSFFQSGTDHYAPVGSTCLALYATLLAYGRLWMVYGELANAARWRSRLQHQATPIYLAQCLCLIPIAYWNHVQSIPGIWLQMAPPCRALFYVVLLAIHSTARREIETKVMAQDAATREIAGDRSASILSGLLFAWTESLIWKSVHETLRAKDLFFVDYYRCASVVVRRYNDTTYDIASLFIRLFRFFWYDILVQGAWATLTSCTVFMPAILTRALLRHLVDGALDRSTAWLCVAALLVFGTITTIADTQAEWLGNKTSAKVRALLNNQIYRKVQRRQIGSKEGSEEGNIVNLMAADTEMVCMMAANLHLAWIFPPVQLLIATYLLYSIMGISGVLGVAFMLISLPLNVIISKKEVAAQAQVLGASDERIEASNEVINTIRTIKYCAWEKPFRAKVILKRNQELGILRTRFIWWSIAMTVFYSLPFLVTIATCFFYTVVFGNRFSTVVAFPALAVFAVLRIPLNRLSESISYLLQAHVSLTRIQTFLRSEETEKNSRSFRHEDERSSSTITFEGASLVWPTNDVSPGAHSQTTQSQDTNVLGSCSQFSLQDINLEILEGSLTLVCGPTGSGKTSLLLAMLGEMKLSKGQVFLPHDADNGSEWPLQPHSIAYCSQEPWIFNQSIRSNILFGLPFAANRYQSVLSATSLERDIAEFDDADRTLAGESGNKLSGGQKQRVALARALYSDAKLLILDDCLSALDVKTSAHVFARAIRGPLMYGRTCVFATHNIDLAGPHCDHAVFIRDGQVQAQGRWEEIVQLGLADTAQAKSVHVTSDAESSPAQESGFSTRISQSVQGRSTDDYEAGAEEALLESSSDKEDALKHEEEAFEGTVPWSKVQIYLRSMGPLTFWTIVFAAFVGQQLISLGLDLCIKAWARQYDQSTESPGISRASLYLSIYGGIGLLYALATFFRDAIAFYGSLRASSATYQRLLDSILHAKLSFFDRVPVGQIINRFSADVGVLDEHLATFSVSTLQIGISVLLTIALIAYIFPVFIIPMLFILAAYYGVMHLYVRVSRDLKQIENISKSPLYQHLSEAISGHVTIRAYGQAARLEDEVNTSIDKLNTPFALLWAAKGWLSFRVCFLSSVIQCLTGVFVLWKADTIDPGNAGLALTYAATLSENVMWFVQIYAIVQQNLNSLERILEYTGVEQERLYPVRQSTNIPSDWPVTGSIEFINYTTTYSDDQSPVLKDVTFKVQGGQRVAIVGRTGAGKSTMTLALIRGLEATGGKIVIDGLDIASLPLQRLREVVTVVPQDPVLFSGSIRDNLDPLQQYSDEEIAYHLKTVNFSVAHGTDIPTNPSGSQIPHPGDRSDGLLRSTLSLPASRLSRGQGQVLCIVRALLRNSRVLVLDEATASIDYWTDQQIQTGLRASVAKGTTVIAIAHRLATIADYDHVVVLDAGRVVQQGSVKNVLRSGEQAYGLEDGT